MMINQIFILEYFRNSKNLFD